MVDYLRVVLSNTWINLTYTTGHFVLKPLAVNVRYAEILALPLNVPFWPKAPVDGTRPNDRSRIADAQAIPMDIA